MKTLNIDLTYPEVYSYITGKLPIQFKVSTEGSELSDIEQQYIRSQTIRPYPLRIDLPKSSIVEALMKNSVNQLYISPFLALRLVAEIHHCRTLFEPIQDDLWIVSIFPESIETNF